MSIRSCFVAVLAGLPLACGSSSETAGKDAASPGTTGGVGAAAGVAGAAPSDSGGSGAGANGGAPAVEALIQEISLDTIPRDTQVRVNTVFVTAKGADQFWIQEPVGVTTPDQEYPRYAGLQVFPDPRTNELRFAVQSLKIGDCIDLSGRVARVGGHPELDKVQMLVIREPADCGTPPEPLLIDSDSAFATIISDSDPEHSEPQPASNAVAYNGLVLRVPSLTVKSTTPTGEHVMERAGASGYLAVFPPLQNGAYNVETGRTYSAVTGVYTNGIRLSTQFGLAPRTVEDLEP